MSRFTNGMDSIIHNLEEDVNVREYSDMLSDMIDDGVIDAKNLAKDLIYWCSEDDIRRYMEVNDLIIYDDADDEEYI